MKEVNVMDWRLTNQSKYLLGKNLKKAYFPHDSKNDHEHCEFCWAKFGINEECLSHGYTTIDGYHWICEQCFLDFKYLFNWKVDEHE